MAENTKIEWCDHTINFWWGCEKVSPGCANCYAAAQSHRLGEEIWGRGAPRKWVRSAAAVAHKLNERAQREGIRYRVFANSMSDFFEEDHGQRIVWFGKADGEIGQLAAWHRDDIGPCTAGETTLHRVRGDRLCTLTDLRRWAWRVIDSTPNLDWIVVTKRPENIQRMTPAYFPGGYVPEAGAMNQEGPRTNLILLTSVENQAAANTRIPHLLRCRGVARVIGLSMEPLLGPVDFRKVNNHDGTCPNLFDGTILHVGDIGVEHAWSPRGFLGWVIVGGESGPQARHCRPEWVRSIIRQCREAHVPCFLKQLGANVVTRNDLIEDDFNNGAAGWPDPDVEHNIHGFREDYQGADCRIRLRDRKGGDWSEWPEDLRVREFPEVNECG